MIKINLIGTIFGQTGYDAHCRYLFNALVELGADVSLEVPLPYGYQIQCNDAEIAAIEKPYYEDGITIAIQTPPYWRFAQAKKCKQFFGYVVWEGEKIPKYWIKHLFQVDGILVPSTHVKDAILNTYGDGFKTVIKELYDKIDVIPHGVDLSIFTPNTWIDEAGKFPPKRKFTFVANKGWSNGMNDRGGIQFVIKAFCEEFKKEEKVQLKIKINTAYCQPGWNLANEINKLELPKDHAEFLTTTDYVTQKGLSEFYNEGDVFVCASMAEAFNIPGLEAKACGLPTIQTGFGGQTDYMEVGTDYYVDYTLEEVKDDIMYEGNNWATPDLNALRDAMRLCFNNGSDYMKQRGRDATKEASKFTWRDSAKKLLEVIK